MTDLITDLQAVECAFYKIFNWILSNDTATSHEGKIYLWSKGDYAAMHSYTSNVGEFLQIKGPKLNAYLHPQYEVGRTDRLDLRDGCTVDILIKLADNLHDSSIGLPNDDPVTAQARAAFEKWGKRPGFNVPHERDTWSGNYTHKHVQDIWYGFEYAWGIQQGKYNDLLIYIQNSLNKVAPLIDKLKELLNGH